MNYREPIDRIKPESLELIRARRSLREELEAIDWYQERIDATGDESLRRILEHNRDEEKEHVAVLTEWIRQHDPTQDKMFEEHD
jgi:hypothetical protein